MATVRAYTTIEQSRKLAEILPLESADMFYVAGKVEPIFIGNKMVACGEDDYDCLGGPDVLCWSLAALLGILPDYTLQTSTDGTVFVVCESKKPMISDAYDNPINACVAMVEKLHELNLL